MDANLTIGLTVVAALSAIVLLVSRIVVDAGSEARARLLREGNAVLDDAGASARDKQIVETILYLSERPAGGWMVLRSYFRSVVRSRPVRSQGGTGMSQQMMSLTADFAVAAITSNPVALFCATPLVLFLAVRDHLAWKKAIRATSPELSHQICHV